MQNRCALAVFLAAALVGAQDRKPNPDITASDLLEHVRRLASDEWAGRGTGSDGEKRATEYIAAHFGRLGLKPVGEKGTWFQDVSMSGGVEYGKCKLELRAEAGEPVVLKMHREFRPFDASAAGVVEGDAVFAGYGVTAPELGYDDFAGLDVTGKVVFVFRHTPHIDKTWATGKVRGTHAPFQAKYRQVVKRGAIGLVVVNDPFSFPATAPKGRRRPRPDRAEGGGGSVAEGLPRIPFVHLTLAAARRVFPQLFGATPDDLEKQIHGGKAPASRAGKMRIRAELALTRKTLVGRNVCALLEAKGKAALDEIIVVGGHHDHLGRGMRGSLERNPKLRTTIHNGADDNASGTSGVLEVAEYMAARKDHLRRSILFMTFTGEERGLVGSRHFVNHPTVPLDKVVAMINMDMIGRLEGKKLFVGGVGTSPVFLPLIKRVNETIHLDVQPGPGGRAPSDNTSFYNKNKPVLFFFTGMHPDYHRPSDDWNKVDAEGIERVARLAGGVVDELARTSEPIPFQRADSGGFGPPRAVLGISAGPSEAGVAVAGLAPGSAAAKAGILRGDVIVEVAGRKTPDLRALRAAMRRRTIGEKIKLKVLRDGKTLEFEVALGRG